MTCVVISPQSIGSGWLSWIPSASPMRWKFNALQVASWLNTPVCSVRENFYRFYILNETARTILQKVQQVTFLTLGIIAYTLLTPFTAPVGIALRGLISTCEAKPYVYIPPDVPGKTLPANQQISLVSYNACLMPAGYSITDGQVTPSSDRARIDRNIQKLKELNPDILCLFEVEDVCDAAYLSSQLPEYPFIIPVAGTRAVGPSSMFYVASKYRIHPAPSHLSPSLKAQN